MKKIKTPLYLFLLTLSILSLFVFSGCGGNTAPVTTTAVSPASSAAPAATTSVQKTTSNPAAPSQRELSDILSGSVKAQKDLDTFKYDINMEISMTTVGGNDAGQMTIVSDITGASIMSQKAMQMKMDMSMDSTMSEVAPGVQNISMDMYVLENYLYMKMGLPGVGDQWVKVPFSEEMEEAYSLNMVDQQLAPLESVSDVKFVKYDTKNGYDCYVMSITPDLHELMALVGDELPEDVDASSLDQVADIFKTLSYNVWIDKKTGYLTYIDCKMKLDMNADQFGAGEDTDFDSMAMDVDMVMSIYDYNKPISITLPDAAKNAIQMPAGNQ